MEKKLDNNVLTKEDQANKMYMILERNKIENLLYYKEQVYLQTRNNGTHQRRQKLDRGKQIEELDHEM